MYSRYFEERPETCATMWTNEMEEMVFLANDSDDEQDNEMILNVKQGTYILMFFFIMKLSKGSTKFLITKLPITTV